MIAQPQLARWLQRALAARKWYAYILALVTAPMLGYTLANSTAWYAESLDLVLLLAVILSVYLGGKAPGIIALALTTLVLSLVDFTSAAPHLNWLFNIDRWAVFFIVGSGAALLVEWLQHSRHEARDRELQLKAMIAALPDAVLIVDHEHRIVLINSAACQLNMCNAESVIGRTFSEVFRIVDVQQQSAQQRLFELARSAAASVLSERYTLLRDDGQHIPLEISSGVIYQDDQGNQEIPKPGSSDDATQPQFVIFTLRDVSQQRRTESMLPGALHVLRVGTDGSTSLPYASPAFQEVYGVNPEECVQDATLLMQQIAPDDFSWVATHITENGARMQRTQIEFQVRHPTKGIVWLAWNAIPARDIDGSTLWNGIFIDVTQRKLAERSLQQSEARLLGIVDSAMDAIITVDEQQGILLFNPAAEHMFRCAETSVIGLDLEEFVNNFLRADSLLLLNMLERDEISNLRLGELSSIFGRRIGGEEFPLELAVSRSHIDGHRLLTMTLRDITERKRTAERLQLSQQQLQAALEAGAMGVMRVYIESRQVEFDEQTRVLCGIKQSPQLWHPIATLFLAIHPADRRRVAREYLRAVAGRSTFRTESRVLHKDGSVHWLVFRGRVDQSKNTAQATLTSVVTDVTYRKQLEEQRLQSQKLESLGVLAGGIAHDFNNLLLAISGNLKLALSDLTEQHPANASLREIAKAATRATDLVRRILAFSRPHDHKRDPVIISTVLDEVLGLARAVLPATVAIRTVIVDSSPVVLADAGQIHQAIINLLTNAADAVPTVGGEVEVRLDTVDVDAQLISQESELRLGRYARITITDNGHGIDQRIVQRIFDPFYTTKAVGQGTGLGLAIVHGIMKGHDGVVVVHSEIGIGTRFELYFPLHTAAITAMSPTKALADSNRRGHILYVDDEEALVFLVTRILQRAGHQVTGLTEPAQALAVFRQQPDVFDMVVSDMSMPGMSGLELARQVLAIRPQLPFIITTGFVRAEDYQAANNVGVRQLILKPNTVEELSAALEKVLLQQAATATA